MITATQKTAQSAVAAALAWAATPAASASTTLSLALPPPAEYAVTAKPHGPQDIALVLRDGFSPSVRTIYIRGNGALLRNVVIEDLRTPHTPAKKSSGSSGTAPAPLPQLMIRLSDVDVSGVMRVRSETVAFHLSQACLGNAESPCSLRVAAARACCLSHCTGTVEVVGDFDGELRVTHSDLSLLSASVTRCRCVGFYLCSLSLRTPIVAESGVGEVVFAHVHIRCLAGAACLQTLEATTRVSATAVSMEPAHVVLTVHPEAVKGLPLVSGALVLHGCMVVDFDTASGVLSHTHDGVTTCSFVVSQCARV